MTYEEADKYYQDNFPPEMSFGEISDKINAISDNEAADKIRIIFAGIIEKRWIV